MIAFHGTSKKYAKEILKEGFKPWTYFAKDVDPAIRFGGIHVFTVIFDEDRIPDNWQFRTRERVSPDRIVQYTIYKRRVVFEDTERWEKLIGDKDAN